MQQQRMLKKVRKVSLTMPLNPPQMLSRQKRMKGPWTLIRALLIRVRESKSA